MSDPELAKARHLPRPDIDEKMLRDAETQRAEIEARFYAGEFKDYEKAMPAIAWLMHELELQIERRLASTEAPTMPIEREQT